MALRWSRRNVVFALGFLCCSTYMIAFYVPQSDSCSCQGRGSGLEAGPGDKSEQSREVLDQDHDHLEWGTHKLAVIVPFRNRFEELLEFAPHLHKFLNDQNIRHRIFVVNQADSLRFNRASLINIGFLQSRLECDYIAMHDVDLLPDNLALNYSYPELGPFHVAAPELHPLYHYKTFVGGILLVNNQHFQQLNGLSNKFWGWGREDDEFYLRMQEASIKVYRPQNIKTNSKNTFRHLHDKYQHPRDYTRYGKQRKLSKRDHFTGIDTVQYSLLSRKEITVDRTPVTILNVRLQCDIEDTPWCMSPEQIQSQLAALSKVDPEKASYLENKLFGPDGLLIPPPKSTIKPKS